MEGKQLIEPKKGMGNFFITVLKRIKKSVKAYVSIVHSCIVCGCQCIYVYLNVHLITKATLS